MMLTLFLAMFLGIFVGIVTGTLPGLGLTSTLFLLYIFISWLDPVVLLVFYVSLICSVQYFGSVVGIYLGIPGEINSLISSKSGFKLMHRGHGGAALGSTAIASLLAAFFGITIFYFFVNKSIALLPLLSVKITFGIFFVILLSLVMYKYNSYLYNFYMVAAGILMSMIGYNSAGISITFNLDILNPGLSTAIVLLMIYIIPNLLKYWNSSIATIHNYLPMNLNNSIGWIFKRPAAVIRGTFIGACSGLIPGVGPIICSNLAGSFEQKLNKHKTANELIAAESANNAAIMVSLIPFFGLGLAILPHEAVINDILINQGITFNLKWLEQNNKLEIIVLFTVIANILAFLIAWPASKILITIYKKINYKNLVVTVISLVIAITLYQSYETYRFDLDFLTMLILLPLTYFLTKNKIETLPFVFSFLIGDHATKSALLLYNIL